MAHETSRLTFGKADAFNRTVCRKKKTGAAEMFVRGQPVSGSLVSVVRPADWSFLLPSRTERGGNRDEMN
jgi:hypothetical protein